MPDVQLTTIITDLTDYFEKRKDRMAIQFSGPILNLLKQENVELIRKWILEAFNDWKDLSDELDSTIDLVFSNKKNGTNQTRKQEQLYVDIEEYEGNIHREKWQVPMSLRVIEPEAAIKINSI
jgi:hypothetical protein